MRSKSPKWSWATKNRWSDGVIFSKTFLSIGSLQRTLYHQRKHRGQWYVQQHPLVHLSCPSVTYSLRMASLSWCYLQTLLYKSYLRPVTLDQLSAFYEFLIILAWLNTWQAVPKSTKAVPEEYFQNSHTLDSLSQKLYTKQIPLLVTNWKTSYRHRVSQSLGRKSFIQEKRHV